MTYANIAQSFMERAKAHPDKAAVIDGERVWHYGELNSLINATAQVLTDDLGIKPGDRVAYLLPNSIELVQLYYAIQKIAAIAVPLNCRLIASEIKHLLTASGSKALFFSGQVEDAIRQAWSQKPADIKLVYVGEAAEGFDVFDELCVNKSNTEPTLVTVDPLPSRIQFTGGTTGIPKGALRSHHADLVEIDGILDSIGLGNTPDDVTLVQSPMAHHGGHGWLTATLSVGATLVLCDAFDPRLIVDMIARHRVSHMVLLPPLLYDRLADYAAETKADLSSVRVVQSAAGVLTKKVIAKVFTCFPRAVLSYGWGQSESGLGLNHAITAQMLAQNSPLLDSVGRPMKHVELRIVDQDERDLPFGQVGEALVKSQAVMLGYYLQDDLSAAAFTADGWLRTGDMMWRDEAGYYRLAFRKKDMIKSGGENVFIAEVERVIQSHPAVVDCVVFSTQDEVVGEAVAAVVQVEKGIDLSAEDVRNHCKRFIASYKKPRYVAFIDDMDRDGAGKVRKQRIVDYFEQQKEQGC